MLRRATCGQGGLGFCGKGLECAAVVEAAVMQLEFLLKGVGGSEDSFQP